MANEGESPGSLSELPKEMPELFMISEDVIKKWLNIPPDQPVAANLARVDIDRLYFSIFRMAGAIYLTNSAVGALAAGNNSEAFGFLTQSNILARICENNVKQFFEGLMVAATKGPNHG